MKSVDAINHIHPPTMAPGDHLHHGGRSTPQMADQLVLLNEDKVEAHEAQEPAWNASIDRTAS